MSTMGLMPVKAKARVGAGHSSEGRVPWGTLSRSQVIDAAVRVLDRGSYEQLTIRALAAELGAAPMSLYRHVRDKDDLLDEVVDRLLANAWQPSARESNWKAYISEACEKLRALLVAEPAALHVYLKHPVASPSAVARMQSMMAVLKKAGLTEAAARRAYAALHTYTIGFAALEAGRAGWKSDGADVDDLARQLAAFTTPRQFSEGLRYLVDAVEQRRN